MAREVQRKSVLSARLSNDDDDDEYATSLEDGNQFYSA